MSMAPFHVADIFDDVHDALSFSQALIRDVSDSHAPMKRRRPVNRPVPFMNAGLRKACHSKSMARNKYFKFGRTKQLWESFRKQRNHASKIKAKSMKVYFDSKCNNIPKHNGAFWETLKPFMSHKKQNKRCLYHTKGKW